MIREQELSPTNGIAMAAAYILLFLLLFGGFIGGGIAGAPILILLSILGLGAWVVGLRGFFSVQPNSAAVVTLFGNYQGTVKKPGLWWTNPFVSRRTISLRVRNLETQRLKVNDANSNPIEIAAIVVWKVVDAAEACFEVDDYERYVNIQAEAAVRTLAQKYPYDAHKAGEISLSSHTSEVSAGLLKAVEERLAKAGVEVIEARISHLAYSPEIAAAMLQRQQASAVVAARQQIVEGAVGMVEHALELLSVKGVVTLDEERKAAMVSNLLVVLCSDRAASPVVNTGTLY